MEETSRRPEYLRFFGLTAVPFPATADPRRIFAGTSYATARATLVEGLTARRGVLCLLGEAGTGKTMLLRQLRESPPPGVRTVMPLHPGLERDEIVELVASAVAIPARDLDGLGAALAVAAEAVALLVDEAQALPAATLGALPDLVRVGLQIVLAGQPPLEARLEEAGLAVVKAALAPLRADEVTAYVRFRLAAVGLEEPPFEPAALAAVTRVTRGVPRLVNTICEASLVAACAAGVRVVTAEHVRASWMGHWRFDPSKAPIAGSALEDALPPPSPTPRGAAGPLAPPTRTTTRGSEERRRWPALAGLTALAVAAVVSYRVGAWWLAERDTAPTRIAAVPVAVGEPPPPRGADVPTPAEALDVVDAFRRAYEARDAGRLRPLLAVDVVEDGRSGAFEVAVEHGRVFARLDTVDYVQPTARLEPRGDAMEVRAPFVIRYRDRAGRSGEASGTATWRIARRDGVARIVEIEREMATGSRLP
jgi:type II secretory pathway predicted ATPase ExeA